MTASDMRICVDCSAEFKRSRTDSTVRCPDCRRARRERRETTSATTAAHARMIEAKLAAYAARREHGRDSDEARAALADFTAARTTY